MTHPTEFEDDTPPRGAFDERCERAESFDELVAAIFAPVIERAGAGYKNWTPGDIPTATQFDTFLQEQSNMAFDSAAARDTALSVVKAELMVALLRDLNTRTTYTGTGWSTEGPIFGALTPYTPVVNQNAIPTITNTYSRWTRYGRLINGWFNVSCTSAGTASNVVIVSLPVTAAHVGAVIGVGSIFDTSASNTYKGLLQVHSTATSVSFKNTDSPAEDDRLGVSGFTAALASGDDIRGQFTYEAAADG